MLKINLVAVGKVKEKYFNDGIAEYVKRLSKFCTFNLIEVQEENYTKVDDSIAQIIMEKESQRISKYLKGYVVAFAIEGKKYSSTSFASLLDSLSTQGNSEITFVIGGSYGLSKEIKARANQLMSFSDMTFPHTLFRLMTVEQIYRAFCINNGVAYHK